MPRSIATTDRVELDQLLDFARTRHHLVLATQRQDGSPQVSPVTGGVDAGGRVVISSYPERAKTRNVRRTGRASVLVLSDEWDDAWVQIDGDAEVLDAAPPHQGGDEALDAFEEYFRCISGEHPDWTEYRQAMVDQGKSLIRITPTRWGPIATGGFPARLA
jgi:PPOX class probable F420-dependent enzyme